MQRWKIEQAESGVHLMRLDKQSDENAAAEAPESTFTIWFSDLKTLWSEKITSQEVFKRFSEKNRELAVDGDDVIKSQLIDAISTVANIKNPEVLHDDDGDAKLNLKYAIFDDVEVEFQWCLKKCDSPVFFEQMTKAFLRQIGELQEQKKQLIDIAKKKDDEIGQYKLQLGQVEIRRRFITQPIEENIFELQTESFDGEFGKLESAIGLLPKTGTGKANETVVKDESCSTAEQPAVQNTAAVKQTSPRGKRHNPRRPVFRAPIVRTGQYQYNDDDDDDEDNDNGSNIESKRRSY